MGAHDDDSGHMDYAADWLSTQIDRATLGAPAANLRFGNTRASVLGPFVDSASARPSDAAEDPGLHDVRFCAQWATPFYRIVGVDAQDLAGLPAITSRNGTSVYVEGPALRAPGETRSKIAALAQRAEEGCLRIDPCDDAVLDFCCATGPPQSDAPWRMFAIVAVLAVILFIVGILTSRTSNLRRLRIMMRRLRTTVRKSMTTDK